MLMDNVFIYQSAELPDFARSPKGSIGVFFCEWDKNKLAQTRITGKFKHSSLKVKGKCSIKSFNATDPDTGKGFKVLMVEVIEPIAARQQRGRPLGPKKGVNTLAADSPAARLTPRRVSMSKVGMGAIVTPVDAATALAIVSPTPDASEAEDLAGKSKDLFDKHLDDVTSGKVTKFWPLY
jgi:hypothetical protein